MMDVLHLSYDEIMYKRSWINLRLLMLDKLRYVGKSKEEEEREMTAEEENEFFKKIKRNGN
jgi:hypothetical protein